MSLSSNNNNDIVVKSRPITSLQSSILLEAPTEGVAVPPVAVEEEEGKIISADASAAKVKKEPVKSNLPSYLDDGFVFGMDGSGLTRPKGKAALVVTEGDTLETQPYQVAMVTSTMATHMGISAFSIYQIITLNCGGNILAGIAQSIAVIMSSWVLSDLGSGVLHWSVDNYGNGRTPIFGGIIAAFQGHHTAPWTITERGFCNNVHKLCIPFGIPTIAAISAISGPKVSLFFAVFCTMEILSQEFHKWSHQKAREVPGWANSLMDFGISISRKSHSFHHNVPFKDNYCIVSGFCNDMLDESGFFRMLEHQVYKMNGVESNAWKIDPNLRERTLRGDYALPKRGTSPS